MGGRITSRRDLTAVALATRRWDLISGGSERALVLGWRDAGCDAVARRTYAGTWRVLAMIYRILSVSIIHLRRKGRVVVYLLHGWASTAHGGTSSSFSTTTPRAPRWIHRARQTCINSSSNESRNIMPQGCQPLPLVNLNPLLLRTKWSAAGDMLSPLTALVAHEEDASADRHVVATNGFGARRRRAPTAGRSHAPAKSSAQHLVGAAGWPALAASCSPQRERLPCAAGANNDSWNPSMSTEVLEGWRAGGVAGCCACVARRSPSVS